MRRIHKISGQITCQLKKNATKDYLKEFLIHMGERANYRRQTFGYYQCSGGKYSIENSVNKTFLLKFIDSKPTFVDILCHTSTREFATCNISFYLRDYAINFNLLKKNLRSRCSDLKEESNGNLDNQIITIADRYMKTNCACFTPNKERLDDIVRLAKEYQVSGVIHYNLQFCHTYANEAVLVEQTLEKEGIPLLRIETDYTDEDIGQLRTRIDAFLEMIQR